MIKPLNRFLLILIVVISLPAIIFSIYEISSLNENEKMIEDVYKRQLNSVLLSINQFSIEAANEWLQKINLLVADSKNLRQNTRMGNVNQFLKLNSDIRMLLFADQMNLKSINLYSLRQDTISARFYSSIENILSKNNAGIKRLLANYQVGSRKIEPVKIDPDENLELLLFPLTLTYNKNDMCGIFIEPKSFITQILLPEILSIAQDDFVITIKNIKTNAQIFSTNGNAAGEFQKEGNLSLFPNYSMGIYLRGQTIAGLVEERINRNLILVFIIDAIFVLGLWYSLKNIKKEIELAKIKSDFVSNVSHELRTPLSLISLFAETLTLGKINSAEKQKEYYTIIYQESSRLSRIVNKILSFYKIEENKRDYHFADVDLNSVVDNILKAYGYHLEQSGFSFSFSRLENIPPILADIGAIEEAIINLIDNAMKYSNERKVINIQTGMDDKFVFVKIKDQGIGISENDQKKIFEKFYRIHVKSVHNTKGVGLGLTIVKDIMDAHKGAIVLESSKGNGSCFSLKFKLSEQKQL